MSIYKGYERPAHSRAPETNHDIAVILKEYSVKLPARKCQSNLEMSPSLPN